MTEQNFLSSGFEDLMRAAVRPSEPQPEIIDRIWLKVKQETVNPVRIQAYSRKHTFLWAAVAVLIIMVISVLIISPQRVLAEVRRLFEVFVPGYGFVQEESSLRMILKPVRVERDGSWDTVEQAFTDSTRTLIVPGDRNYAGELNTEGCMEVNYRPPYLKMAASTGEEMRLDLTGKQGGLIFPPIPSDIQDVTLVMKWTSPCMDEPDWEFPLHFEPAPPGTVIPVIAIEEIKPTTGQTSTEVTPALESTLMSKPELNLETVVETDNGYIFGGRLTWQEEPVLPQRYDMPMAESLQLIDAAGKALVLNNTNPFELQVAPAEQKSNELKWAYQVNGKDLANPLTLTVPFLTKFVDEPTGTMKFDLDFGAEPQAGMAWEAERSYELDGKKFSLFKVEYSTDPTYPDYYEIQYKFMVDAGIRSIYIYSDCPGQTLGPMGGGGGSSGTIEVVDGVLYGYSSLPAAPAGLCTFTITGIEYEDATPWQISIPLPGK